MPNLSTSTHTLSMMGAAANPMGGEDKNIKNKYLGEKNE